MDSDFRLEAEYDKEQNIVFVAFIGFPKSREEVDFLVNKRLLPAWKGDGVHKTWRITDITRASEFVTPPIKRYGEITKKTCDRYIEGTVIITNSLVIRAGLKFFNIVSGKKYPVVATFKEAMEVIKKWQAERGVFASLQDDA